jgi:hypothetical protein
VLKDFVTRLVPKSAVEAMANNAQSNEKMWVVMPGAGIAREPGI